MRGLIFDISTLFDNNCTGNGWLHSIEKDTVVISAFPGPLHVLSLFTILLVEIVDVNCPQFHHLLMLFIFLKEVLLFFCRVRWKLTLLLLCEILFSIKCQTFFLYIMIIFFMQLRRYIYICFRHFICIFYPEYDRYLKSIWNTIS